MNEHGFTKMVDGKKTTKLDKYFPDEQSIFKFLNMRYKKPTERLEKKPRKEKRVSFGLGLYHVFSQEIS